jgi:hypothetical protein
VAFQTPPQRHWRSYGTDPLPSPNEALGGLPGQAELLTGIESASSRPVRKIVLLSG